MTIGEAIDYLNSLHGDIIHGRTFKQEALQLGIESLKRLQADREVIPSDKFFRLPGETKD